MGQLNGLPPGGAIRSRLQVENGAAIDRITRIPAGSHGDLGFPIAINVRGRDTNMIEFGEVLGDYVFLPIRIVIPGDLVFIDQQNVRFLGNSSALGSSSAGFRERGAEYAAIGVE